MNVSELIEIIHKRTGMFAENICLEEISQFIGGFVFANVRSVQIDEIDIAFKNHFHEWVRKTIELEYNIRFEEDRNYTYYINACFEPEKRLDIFFDMCDRFFSEYREKSD